MRVATIKFGGSLITDKRGSRSIRRQTLARLADELVEAMAGSRRRFLLGHGSGSFGHVVAARHGVHRGRGGAAAASATQAVARQLHEAVLEALRGAGLAVWSVAPSSSIVTTGGRPVSVAVAPVARALQRGLTVVCYGDVVLDRAQGHAICSTETALLAYVRRLRRHGVIVRDTYWFGDTDGILDASGATIRRLSAPCARQLRHDVGGAGATDVTGGMRHRLDTAIAFARLGARSWILDGSRPGVLPAALAGTHRGGTRIAP